MIERLSTATFAAAENDLAHVLTDAVDGGASVGFLSGLDQHHARQWWRHQSAQVTAGTLAVWVARHDTRIVGTISLAYAGKDNARHRAEVIKLAVLRTHRGRGHARRLLTQAEHTAAATGITLLLLDTETGSPAETLYRSTGWQQYGTVPAYAADPAGTLRGCSFYYKELRPA